MTHYCPWLVVPGNEIPTFFDKQKGVPLDHYRGSFTVDIPDCYCSCQWWGIVLCALVEPSADVKGKNPLGCWYLSCCFVAPDVELKAGPPLSYLQELQHFELLDRRHLIIHYYNGGLEDIRQVIKDGHNQVKLYCWMCSDATGGEYPCKEVKVIRYGWRVICEKEARQSASLSDMENHPSDSNL